jgi:MFS family permease
MTGKPETARVELPAHKPGWSDGLTSYHYLVLVVACLGWSFDTMDQWLFVFAKQHAIASLLGAGAGADAVAKYSTIATAALMIGWATGGLFFGMVGDRLGRTRTMAFTILLYAGFTGLSGLSHNWQQFAFFRFMTGLGVGGEFAAGAALVAETFPSHSRALALGIVQATSALGNISAGLINLGFAHMYSMPNSPVSPDNGWRYLFAIGIIPALLVFIIFMFIHEPEQWQRAREAQKKGQGGMGNIFGLFAEPWVRRNTLVGLTIASVGVIGFWGISVWTPELLRSVLNPHNLPELKGTVERQISYAGMAQNLGSFFGALGFATLSNRIGRRGGFAVALGACVAIVPATFIFTTSFASALVLFFLMGYALLFLLAGFAVYFPELFPTRLRSTGTGFCYNVARYVTAATLFGTSAMVAKFGLPKMVVFVSIVFVLGFFILPFAPETKGKPLPE